MSYDNLSGEIDYYFINEFESAGTVLGKIRIWSVLWNVEYAVKTKVADAAKQLFIYFYSKIGKIAFPRVLKVY